MSLMHLGQGAGQGQRGEADRGGAAGPASGHGTAGDPNSGLPAGKCGGHAAHQGVGMLVSVCVCVCVCELLPASPLKTVAVML